MLADDEEVRYMLGEVFVTMPNETAEEKMQEATEAAEKALEEHEAEVGNIRTQMDDLKVRTARYCWQAMACPFTFSRLDGSIFAFSWALTDELLHGLRILSATRRRR